MRLYFSSCAECLKTIRWPLRLNGFPARRDWFTQLSCWQSSPSPAECLDVLFIFGDDVSLDVMRESHRLPEFTPQGLSRYSGGTAGFWLWQSLAATL